jgi:hypothetical protein
MLPKKRERIRSGIERAPPREWPRHRKFVRSRGCCVPQCLAMTVEFAHVRHETDGGTAVKPSDWWGVSLCHAHHAEQHYIGEPAFEKFYGINLKALALEFARKSTDLAMREVMKGLGLI